jgi:hypothetical protein
MTHQEYRAPLGDLIAQGFFDVEPISGPLAINRSFVLHGDDGGRDPGE